VLGWGNGLIDVLCELRGLETAFYDLCSAPEFVHEAMVSLMRGTLHYLDIMEKGDLIRSELRKGFDKLKGCHSIVCLRDTQTLFGESQRAAG